MRGVFFFTLCFSFFSFFFDFFPPQLEFEATMLLPTWVMSSAERGFLGGWDKTKWNDRGERLLGPETQKPKP